MKFEVLIYPDGKRTHEVTERADGEQCEKILQYGAGTLLADERTGPDCDKVEEIN